MFANILEAYIAQVFAHRTFPRSDQWVTPDAANILYACGNHKTEVCPDQLRDPQFCRLRQRRC
jgi:hypothetical protein